jgi:cysteine rich repeat protein
MATRIALIATLACLSLASAAFAQDADRPHNRGACRDDAQKLCAGVERGGGKIRECLAGQIDKLSDACRKVVESRAK